MRIVNWIEIYYFGSHNAKVDAAWDERSVLTESSRIPRGAMWLFKRICTVPLMLGKDRLTWRALPTGSDTFTVYPSTPYL